MHRERHEGPRPPAEAEGILTPSESELWRKYKNLLERGLRKQALQTLDAFVRRLEAAPPERRSQWVYALCQSIWDRSVQEPVQQPLFIRVILPELRIGYEAKKPHYARWIACFSQEISSSWRQSLQVLGLSDFWAADFLREALRVDPNDSIARAELIRTLEWAFDYYVHEVPYGVIADPRVFREELGEFEQMVTTHGLTGRYEEPLSEWHFQCEAWAGYLDHRDQFINYEEYLSRQYPIYGVLYLTQWRNGAIAFRSVVTHLTCARCGNSYLARVQFRTGHDLMQRYDAGEAVMSDSGLESGTDIQGVTYLYCDDCYRDWQTMESLFFYNSLAEQVKESRLTMARVATGAIVSVDEIVQWGRERGHLLSTYPMQPIKYGIGCFSCGLKLTWEGCEMRYVTDWAVLLCSVRFRLDEQLKQAGWRSGANPFRDDLRVFIDKDSRIQVRQVPWSRKPE